MKSRHSRRGAIGRMEMEVGPSLLGQGAVTALAIAVMAVAFYLQLGFYVFVAILLVVAVIWAYILHRMNNPAWRRILIAPDGRIVLAGPGRTSRAGRLDGRPLRTPIGLRLTIRANEGDRQSAWLFADSLKEGEYARFGAVLDRLAADS